MGIEDMATCRECGHEGLQMNLQERYVKCPECGWVWSYSMEDRCRS